VLFENIPILAFNTSELPLGCQRPCSFGLAGAQGGPRIEQRDAGKFEVCNIASDDRQTVNQRCRGDQGVAFRAWIGNVKTRAAPRHGCIDREDATFEARQNLIVYPCAENSAVRSVPARNLKRAQLDFKDRNG
jgi:hypothetical protein